MDRCLHRRFPGGHAHGGRLMILRAADDPIPAKLEIRAQRTRQFENDSRRYGGHKNIKYVGHGSSPSGFQALECPWQAREQALQCGTPD